MIGLKGAHQFTSPVVQRTDEEARRWRDYQHLMTIHIKTSMHYHWKHNIYSFLIPRCKICYVDFARPQHQLFSGGLPFLRRAFTQIGHSLLHTNQYYTTTAKQNWGVEFHSKCVCIAHALPIVPCQFWFESGQMLHSKPSAQKTKALADQLGTWCLSLKKKKNRKNISIKSHYSSWIWTNV